MANKIDAGMRMLIAGACVATMAGVGYYLIDEYRSHRQAEEAALQAALSERLREGCLDDLSATFSINQSHPYKIANCLHMGALNESWNQVRKNLDPKRFTLRSVPVLLSKTKAWADYCESERSLEEAISKTVGRKA